MSDSEDIKKKGFLIDQGGDGTSDPGVDDLDSGVKKTLADYLSNQTGVGGSQERDPKKVNRFPIDDTHSETELSDGSGMPVGPTTFPNVDTFATPFSSPQLNRHSQSEYFEEGKASLGNFLSKGGQNKTKIDNEKPWDGHELLKNVANVQADFSVEDAGEGTPTAAVQTYAGSVLKGYNRFDIENRYVNRESFTVQTKLGEFNKDAATVDTELLGKVGRSLGLRASGEFGSNGDPDTASAKNLALLPGKAQAFLGLDLGGDSLQSSKVVDAEELRARKVLADLLRTQGQGGIADELLSSNININETEEKGQRSLGNMTNHVDLFSGLLPLGMIAMHIALFLVALVSILTLTTVLGLLAKPSRLQKDVGGTYMLGQFVTPITDPDGGYNPLNFLGDVTRFLGIKPFTFNFQETVTQGFLVFLGIDLPPSGDDLKEFALDAPGYYVTISRMMFRSVISIGAAFDKLDGGSVIDVVSSITGVLEAIRESKIIKMINFFSQLGDKRLALANTGFEDDIEAYTGVLNKSFAKISGIDKISSVSDADLVKTIKPKVFEKVQLNRLGRRRKLAWSNSTATSMLLLPQAVMKGAATAPFNALDTSDPSAYFKAGDVVANKVGDVRIPTKDRQRLERYLDAEYVPFYFHDLRTNEIISFHAFLGSLTESYTVNSESIEAFGRIDPIMVYKNTQRALDFSFWVVATSENDFDIMWAKINKLMTLLYPQWSAGRQVSYGESTITQPFSQIMTASPLIRLRIGDLIRSNYSRFNLARLFGLGTIMGAKEEQNGSEFRTLISEIEDGDNLDTIKSKLVQFYLRPNGDPASSTYDTGYRPSEETPGIQLGLPGFPSSPIQMPLRITSPVEVEIVEKVYHSNYKVKIVDTDMLHKDSPKEYIVGVDDLIYKFSDKPPEDFDAAAIAEVLSSIDSGFFSPGYGNKVINPLVKSFEDSGGKGLAGMINSVNFEWSEMPWETGRYGARAPKMCLITVSFAPMHDIAPGIDANGFNRAPIYNVGEAMNGVGGDGDDHLGEGKRRFNQLKAREIKRTNSKERK